MNKQIKNNCLIDQNDFKKDEFVNQDVNLKIFEFSKKKENDDDNDEIKVNKNEQKDE